MGLADDDFHVDVRRAPGRLIVRPVGEIDLGTVDRVRRAVAERRGSDALVLDLRALEFLDTSGLQLVVESFRRARDEGWELTLVRGGSGVQRVFEVAGLEGVLPFSDEAPGDDGSGA